MKSPSARDDAYAMPFCLTEPSDIEPWSRLWKSGVLHSCATGIPGNYDGGVRSFWRSQFGHLSNRQCLVDIGTGNGAIPLLAKEFAETKSICLDIHGIDVADIDPEASVPDNYSRYAGIRFHPRTSATALPFATGEVSLLCSQFAFEYMPRDAVTAEIIRVIGRTGRAALVMHSDQSIIATVCYQQLQGCAFLLDTSDFLERAEVLIRVLSQASGTVQRAELANDPSAEIARHGFNDEARALMKRISELEAAEVLRKSAKQVAHALQLSSRSTSAALAMIESVRTSLQDERTRLQQLRTSLINTQALTAIATKFQSAGLSVASSPLYYREGVRLGWAMVIGDE